MITMYKVCVVQVKGVQYGLRVCSAEGVRCVVKAVVNFLLCTFCLHYTPSACTAHTVYQVVIIVFIGMPSLDTSSMQNKMAQGCHLL